MATIVWQWSRTLSIISTFDMSVPGHKPTCPSIVVITEHLRKAARPAYGDSPHGGHMPYPDARSRQPRLTPGDLVEGAPIGIFHPGFNSHS
jgi:hypothetical protein